MTIIYLIVALALGVLQFANRNVVIRNIVKSVFVVLQWYYTYHVITHIGVSEAVFFKFDSLAIIFIVALAIVSTAAFVHDKDYTKNNIKPEHKGVADGQFAGAMQIMTMALTMAYMSQHVAVTWIFVEITTLCASALIFYRRNASNIEATWKYVFACSISLVLVYVGILFLSISMGKNASSGMLFESFMGNEKSLDTFWLKMAFIFILVGYTAKMSLVPMFTAGIDAKDKAPTPAAAMLSSVVMNAGFIGFYRVYGIVVHTDVKEWADKVLIITGLVSILVAAVYLVRVQNIKRLFAYSSVEHMGVVMLGVASGKAGVFAALLHLLLHTFAKAGVFFHIGQLYRVYGSKQVSKMGRYMNHTGLGAVIVILFMMCITAMPPSGLFVTEFLIFKSMVDAEMWVTMILAMVLLTIIVWAIGRDTFSLLFLHAPSPEAIKPRAIRLPWYEMIMQFILIALAIWLGLATPQWLSDLINEAVQIAII